METGGFIHHKEKSTMKKLAPISSLLFALIFIQACSSPDSNQKKITDTAWTTTCYQAIDGQDTATLQLKTFEKKAEGDLHFKYKGKDDQHGTIAGKFSGDTLLVNFYLRNGQSKETFTNPLALLKQDSVLKLGIGEMETMMGRTYFRPDVPINYDRGRFIFEPVPCKTE
ncbi:hypothetical protein SAMN04488084_102339 [Pedobacter antarcticus]|nr:hypothetical protein SAMN04488084_102339 [Pedobacter antarcticus]